MYEYIKTFMRCETGLSTQSRGGGRSLINIYTQNIACKISTNNTPTGERRHLHQLD